MPRRFRLPEGILRRFLLAAGIFLPFLLYIAFRVLPPTRSFLLHVESQVVRVTTRVTQAFHYVFLNEALEEYELALCAEEKAHLAEQVATFLSSDVGPIRTLSVQVVARAYGGDEQHVLVWKMDGEPFVVGEGVGVGKILFGVVLEANNDLAVVRMITHSESAIPAMVLGKEATVGIVSGTGGAWLEFSYVPKGSDVQVGDTLVTSGLGQGVIRGFVLGTVREVIDADPSPFYRIKVEPFIASDTWWEAEVLHVPAL
ncbi:MAG: rod shape-determining protein MreC [Patescibacteria group bacterium]